MAYNEELADRLRELLSSADRVTEQEMFGGISFLIAGNMCCGVLGDDVIVRIEPTLHHDALTRPGVSEFEMGGRTSKGMVRVGPVGTAEDLDLALWVRLGVNHASEMPAKSAKKSAKKAAASRKRQKSAPNRKAPARKKAAPAKTKTAPAKKKAAVRTRPAPLKKKAAAAKRAASAKKTAKTANKKRSAPAGKKATKATRAKKVAKAKKAPRTRK